MTPRLILVQYCFFTNAISYNSGCSFTSSGGGGIYLFPPCTLLFCHYHQLLLPSFLRRFFFFLNKNKKLEAHETNGPSLPTKLNAKAKPWLGPMSNNYRRNLHKEKDLISQRRREWDGPFLSCLSLRITQPLVAKKNNVAFKSPFWRDASARQLFPSKLFNRWSGRGL